MKNGKGKIILLLIISLISINKVNALEMKSVSIVASNISGYDAIGYGNYMIKDVNFKNSWDKYIDFTGANYIKGYDYISIPFHLFYNHDTSISETGESTMGTPENSNQFFCSSWVQRQQTYADGTQSTYYVCSTYSATSGNQTSYSYNGVIENIPEIMFDISLIFNNGNVTSCSIDNINYGTSHIICKIPSSANTISRIRFRNTGTNYLHAVIGSFGISNYYNAWKDLGNVQIQNDNTNTQNVINNNNQNAQDIQNGINNADYTGQTEQPDTTNYDSYKQKEQTLENISQADMSNVNVGLDYNTSNWLWDLVNRIVNVNPIIMSFYITILSIGVIKLIIRR